jgi:hypothetical protein
VFYIDVRSLSFCGLATLTMALNALAIDPGRVWKGVWRWFDESLLDCCKNLDLVKSEGISLEEFNCLAICNGLVPTLVRAHRRTTGEQSSTSFSDPSNCTNEGGVEEETEEEGSLEALRTAVRRATAVSSRVLCVSYSRKELGQTGDGPFSPIGGYHEAKDMVLLLDVARFKHPPHWVELATLHAAMAHHVDKATNLPRGWVELRPRSVGDASRAEDEQMVRKCREENDQSKAHGIIHRLTCGMCPISAQQCCDDSSGSSGLGDGSHSLLPLQATSATRMLIVPVAVSLGVCALAALARFRGQKMW